MSRRKQPHPRHLEGDDDLASTLQNDQQNGSPSSPPGDAHVCGKCRAEFLELAEFLAHKKSCTKKRIIICVGENGQEQSVEDEEEEEEEVDEDSCLIPTKTLNINDADADEFYRNGSDGELDMDHSDYDEGKSPSVSEDGDDFKDNKENDFHDDNFKSEISSHLPQMMIPLAQLLPPNSNVCLEPMFATKAAVAQFAENNLPPADLNLLHTTLYNLQQQQLVQLQLIQQLQQHLLVAASSVLNGQPLTLPPLPLALPPPPSAAPISAAASQPTTTVSSNASSTEPEKPKISISSSACTTSNTTSVVSSLSSVSSSFSSPHHTSHHTSSGAKTSSSSAFKTSSSSNFKTSSSSDFKTSSHSDFDHYPSGERPFKCNICGNRFSTRGNLKVHFTRHRAKYPYVRMNPHPVPEHLDKVPTPHIAAPFPGRVSAPMSLPSGFHSAPPCFTPSKIPSSTYVTASSYAEKPSEKKPVTSPMDSQPKQQASPPAPASEAPQRSSPNVSDTASLTVSVSKSIPSAISTPGHKMSSLPLPMPIPCFPISSSYPLLSPVHSAPPPLNTIASMVTPLGPSAPPGTDPNNLMPTKVIEHGENVELYMETNKSSETSKLQQLVDNIEHKMTDPNQCIICHRVLSCKSALQMHYRIHTGERPFKCKICGRSFTTRGNLKTHMGVHRAKPPLRVMHQCPVCHKQFTNLLVLQQHIRSHSGMSGMHLPNISPFGMLRPPTTPIDWMTKTYGFPSPMPEVARELDLSKTSSMYPSVSLKTEVREDEVENKELETEEGHEEPMDISEKTSDVSAEKLSSTPPAEEHLSPADNKESPGEESRPLSRMDDHHELTEQKDSLERADSVASSVGSGSPESARSVSPKEVEDFQAAAARALMEQGMMHGFPPMSMISPTLGGYSMAGSGYSTSLAALEERVRAIDSSMATPLNKFRPLVFPSGMMNGEHSPPISPRRSRANSECSSEGSQQHTSKPSTPSLSVSSEGSGAGFMLGALDLRPHSAGGKSTTCNICYKCFACRSALDIHYRSHTKERPYRCRVCDRGFSTRGNMRQHMLTHKIRDLPSQAFDKSDDSNEASEDSLNVKSEDMANHEDIANRDDMASHEDMASPESNTKEQDTSFEDAPNTNSESNKDRTTPESAHSPFLSRSSTKHQCEVCQKGFSSASALQIHIRTHTGDKPFKCNVCGKAFTTKGNLKVHMGTHMWNNSPSRRGRRMSIEPPFMLSHKDNPYLPGFAHRSPDFYPFQFPHFMNGLPPPKMNEISVIQSLNGGMSHMPPLSQSVDMSSAKLDALRSENNNLPLKNENHKSWNKGHETNGDTSFPVSESGELDLSMKSSSISPSSSTSPPTTTNGTSATSPQSLSHPLSSHSVWMWKTTCHMCSQSFPSPASLEHHIQVHHMSSESHKGVLA